MNDLSSKTVPELEALTREVGVQGYYKMRKHELITALTQRMRTVPTPPPVVAPPRSRREIVLSPRAEECLELFQDAERSGLKKIDLPYCGDSVVSEVEMRLSRSQQKKIVWGQTGRRTAVG